MENTSIIDHLLDVPAFEQEFCHLKGTCYLDHTGAALYARSQVEAVAKDLKESLLSNPHSNSMPSRLCNDSVDQVRYRILQNFNTTSNEYSVIFTSGATEALKVVAENFEFSGKTSKQLRDSISTGSLEKPCGEFVYLQDNHTSVLGMRNVDNIVLNNVPVRCLPHCEAFKTFSQHDQNGISTNENGHSSDLNADSTIACQSNCNSLFVYPAQCNFSGLKYPLTWIQQVQNNRLVMKNNNKNRKSRWFCLLDAATFVSTNPLDLSAHKPDFVTLSFYKMFGLPTGLGALLVRNSSVPALRKRYYGGGTVQIALSSNPTHVLRPALHQQFEDGTINFLSIVALRHGMDWQERAGLTMPRISSHCFSLARYTHMQLRRLRHSNGQAAVTVYADTAYDDPDTQGGIVNFNMLRDSGEFVGYMEVLTLANLHSVHLRTGCFCNPGACQRHLSISDEQYYKNFEAGHVCGDDHDLINGCPTGSVRVSFGPYSMKSDADRLLHMLTDCFISKPALYMDPDGWNETVKNFKAKFNGLKFQPVKEEHNVHKRNGNYRMKNGIKDETDFKCSELPSKTSETSLCNISSSPITLSQVCLFPVKSCGALSVNSWPLDDRGLLYDRCWMVVTDSGVALTQKHETRLCLIKPLINLQKGILTLTFKGEPNCSVPLDMMQSAETSSWLCESKVCGDNVRGTDCGAHVSKWLCQVLQRDGLRLIRQSSSNKRVASRKSQEEAVVNLALSNQAQFLLVNENSVSWVTEKLPSDSDCPKTNMVDRFRSNFVVKGDCPAFEEQTWSRVTIGSINLTVDGPCGRCQMICIDQSTAKKTKEPLTTLAANFQGKMKFGIYLRQDSPSENTCVTVGDEITPFFS